MHFSCGSVIFVISQRKGLASCVVFDGITAALGGPTMTQSDRVETLTLPQISMNLSRFGSRWTEGYAQNI